MCAEFKETLIHFRFDSVDGAVEKSCARRSKSIFVFDHMYRSRSVRAESVSRQNSVERATTQPPPELEGLLETSV